MSVVPAGKRDRRIKLYRFTDSQSDSGAAEQTPVLIGTFWAEKVQERTKLDTEHHAEEQEIGWSYRRWRTVYFQTADFEDPTVKWELREGLRVYEVLGVTELGRRGGWEFRSRVRSEDQKA